MSPPPTSRIPLLPGIYAPSMTFFDPATEDVDAPTLRAHCVRLARAGLVGLVALGSNGEAVHLNEAERRVVVRTMREGLDDGGFPHIPVICGASGESVRLTLERCHEGLESGASYALLIPPSYYRTAMDAARLEAYFVAVADAAPLPLLIYNYPGAVAGIDLDSDLLGRLAAHPNIVGVKFTCGNTGKLTRVAAATHARTATAANSGFMAFGGMADFTLQTAVSGGSGIIAGGANVVPRTCVQVWRLWEEGKVAEAMALQAVLSQGDWVLTKGAVPGTKAAIEIEYGYGGFARRPLRRLAEEERAAVQQGIAAVMAVEHSLPDFGTKAGRRE